MRLNSKNKTLSTYVAIPALAALALSMASCSNNDDEDIQPGNNVITFTATAPYAQLSRAVTTTATLNSFTVYGFVDGNVYMNNVKVNKTDNKWSYTPVQYWPVDKSVNFFSYSPENITTQTPLNDMEEKRADIPGFINNGTTDLLYGVNIGLSAATTKQVKINFRHALSQVRFLLKRRPGEMVDIHVTNVDLLGTCSIGSFSFPRETTSADNAVTGTWHKQTGVTDFALYQGLDDIDDNEPEEFLSTGYMFAVPQVLAEAKNNDYSHGAYVRVRCRMTDSSTGALVWPSASANGYDAATKTAYVYFPLATSKYNEWEPGKAYRYTLTIGVPAGEGAIDFDITVDEYPEFAQGDID